MKKPSALAEMIAKKAFAAPKFQQCWNAHMQAFGPILAPAYADCYTAKVHITNILNKISRRDLNGAAEVMNTLVKSCGCETSADKALLAFMQGLCCEFGGDKMGMFAHYAQAGVHGHHFYLPHLKNAKFAHESGQLDIACKEYFEGISCIRDMPKSETRAKLLASTLTNAASCLTYMHRYQDAQAMLAEARKTGSVPRIEAVEAVLLAALDREEEMEADLVKLAEANDPDYDSIHDLTQAIIDGSDPHFHPQPVDKAAIAAFWQWFAENESHLRQLYDEADEELPEEFVTLLDAQLAPCFPFKHHPLDVSMHEGGKEPELSFSCSYSRSLNAGYGKLIDACPAEIASRWHFTIES